MYATEDGIVGSVYSTPRGGNQIVIYNDDGSVSGDAHTRPLVLVTLFMKAMSSANPMAAGLGIPIFTTPTDHAQAVTGRTRYRICRQRVETTRRRIHRHLAASRRPPQVGLQLAEGTHPSGSEKGETHETHALAQDSIFRSHTSC